MKNFKLRLFLAAAIIAIGSSIAATIPAKNIVTYHFTGNSTNLADMQNIGNWQGTSSSCGTSGTIPCAYDFDGDEQAFEARLQLYQSAAALVGDAETKRFP